MHDPSAPRRLRGAAHFLNVAARAMRQVIIDHARWRRSEKRAGGSSLQQALSSREEPPFSEV
ncbi:MAG TPA: ECF-type sigma factor [Thermoanaerobaculia bacterium]|nr:ECF-type sigma factor [Thermoanaerobaculia bacterium]